MKLLLSTGMITLATVAAFACSKSEAPPATADDVSSDSDTAADADAAEVTECGPQSPRDITSASGTNSVQVPGGDTPNLCNVHFHDPFEHSGFGPEPAVSGDPGDPVCKSVEVGDKLEFHWVYTNCQVPDEPIKGLANCVCDREDLVLRVFTQAYVVSSEGVQPGQPEGDLVQYAGSTTGPSYNNETCSPARVNWMVNPKVLALSKDALGQWCENNPWPDEDHPHQSRILVTDAAWLSAM